MYPIDTYSYRNEEGFNRRARFLVMHYTACNFQTSIRALTGTSVSSHYLIPDPQDPSYQQAGFHEVRIFNLVDEQERAWHAGVSAWQGRSNLNDSSIGIELVSSGVAAPNTLDFVAFDEQQIQALIQLSLRILKQYPDITPSRVVGHSDISIGRKIDPGAQFPWKRLYDAGIGAWYDSETQREYAVQFNQDLPSKGRILEQLERYGYALGDADQNATHYQRLIRAFQLHFRPQCYDGQLDAETAAILFALTAKYC